MKNQREHRDKISCKDALKRIGELQKTWVFNGFRD